VLLLDDQRRRERDGVAGGADQHAARPALEEDVEGALAGLAGALLANLTGLASPNLLVWTQSGTLLVMVIIGGVGYLYGGVVGALILLCLEEVLVGFTPHWHIVLGLILLGVVLFAPKGVAALFGKRHG